MILCWIGDIGSGKTISAIKYAYEEYLKGRTIYCNLHLFFPKSPNGGKVVPLDTKFFIDYATSRFNIMNSIVLIDEAHIYFDSRNALMRKNKIFGKFITQSRKRSVDLVYTTQDENPETFRTTGQVDLRLRKLTDRVILCRIEKIKDKEFVIQDFYNNSGRLLTRQVVYANPYFNLYDTNEIIVFEDEEEK